MNKKLLWAAAITGSLGLQQCKTSQPTVTPTSIPSTENIAADPSLAAADMDEKLAKYTSVRLSTNLSKLSGEHKQMIPLLIEAAEIMDRLFWFEAYGHQDSLLQVANNGQLEKYIGINYGPWDRLEGNVPFVEGVGQKPAGANFYPADMSKEEFEKLEPAR